MISNTIISFTKRCLSTVRGALDVGGEHHMKAIPKFGADDRLKTETN
jgi:hypothetical protein